MRVMSARVKARIVRRLCGAALCVSTGLAVAGCSTASWQQLFYDVGDQYACQQAGANQGAAAARASQCGDARHPDRSRYQDYKTARDQVVNPPP